MSDTTIIVTRDCSINIFGEVRVLRRGQVLGMRQSVADMLISLGDAELYKAKGTKMEVGPSENKEMLANKDAAEAAEKHGVALSEVRGTGKEGRIRLQDVLLLVKSRPKGK